MLDFGEEVLSFKVHGEKQEMRIPTNDDVLAYTRSLKKCDTDEAKAEALIVFLEELGLPRKVYGKLSPKQSETLLNNLYEAEKN